MTLADQNLPRPDVVPGPMLGELAREERARAALATLLAPLVAGEDMPVLCEELVIRTRAMLVAIAADLLRGLGDGDADSLADTLASELAHQPALLAHCHAQALEGQTLARLAEAGLDPVLSPALENCLAATGDEDTAQLAMAIVAAQSRFASRQRRMDALAGELPSECMQQVLAALGRMAGERAAVLLARLRADYDESTTRLALLSRLAVGGAIGAEAALDPAAAGFSLFATALGHHAGVPRDEAVLAAASGQALRLALLLRAAGVDREAAHRTIGLIHAEANLPSEWLTMSRRAAAALLAGDPA